MNINITMYVHNPGRIKKYLTFFGRGAPAVSMLLESALYIPLHHDARYLRPIESEDRIETKNARRAFRRAREAGENWHFFAPDDHLDSQVHEIAAWLVDYSVHVGPEDFNGCVPLRSAQRLHTCRSLADVFTMKSAGFPLKDIEIEAARRERLVTYEEEKRLARCTGMLSDRCFLLQMTTVQAMKIAGKKAQNCLGWRALPDGSEPHKRRVLNPEKWLYFSVRDPDNNALAMIGVDVAKGLFSVEGNARNPVSNDIYHLVEEAVALIHEAFPHLRMNRAATKPYGASPRLGDCGF